MTSTNKKLEEVYIDFWGPHNSVFLSRSIHMTISICEKTRKIWILYLYSKDEFVDAFQVWLPKVENKLNYIIKALHVDSGGEFISIKIRTFYKKRDIISKYLTPYMHKENSFVKKEWWTIVTLKDYYSLIVDFY